MVAGEEGRRKWSLNDESINIKDKNSDGQVGCLSGY